MKSLIKSFLVIIIVCFSFNSYGQFKFDLKKSVDAVQNGIKGTKGKTDQNKPVQVLPLILLNSQTQLSRARLRQLLYPR